MKNKITLLFFFVFITLNACAPSAQAVETAVAKIQAAYTPTPQPTATIQPTPTPDLVKEYLDAFDPMFEKWRQKFSDFNDEVNKFIEDPALNKDDAFMRNFSVASGIFQASAKNFENLPPAPPQLLKLDQTLDQLILTSLQVTETATYAIVINTPSMWNMASAPIDDMAKQIKIIQEELARNK